jgi:hypothetical protein
MPTQNVLPSSKSNDAVVNLIHLKLFHHFQTCTQKTLLLKPEVWERALQLSFRYELLMNAVLCVASRHLAFLKPEDTTHSTAAASHLSRALSLFRQALSNTLASTHIDAFLATSILLQVEVWTSTDFYSSREDGVSSFDPSRDRIFSLNSSLKQVFLKSIPLISNQRSTILPHIAHNPRVALAEAAQISDSTLADYQNIFSYHRPLTSELLNVPLPYIRGRGLASSSLWQDHVPKIKEQHNPIHDGYMNVVTELCLILSYIPEAQPPDSISAESPLLPDLARYIFSFPVLCRGPFASMIQQSNPYALLLLYHFYRAVRILLPPNECWWAYKRATLSETILKEWLTREIAK